MQVLADERPDFLLDMDSPRLSFLGGFALSFDGCSAFLGSAAQRLLVFLGLRGPGRFIKRPLAAGTLWPDVPESRASANLRSVLWRLEDLGHQVVSATPIELGLDPRVRLDLWEGEDLARRLLDHACEPSDSDLGAGGVGVLSTELLPDCYEEWVLAAGETWRQLRLHALEELARHLMVKGRYGEALVAALASVRAEPLRESAHAAVIRVHLAEGNQCEAMRTFERYRTLLLAELGIEPTPPLWELARGAAGGRASSGASVIQLRST